MNIGLIGIGRMGIAAAKLLTKSFPIMGYDISEKAREHGAKLGLNVMDNLANFSKKADLVLMFLPGPQQVSDIVSGSNGLLRYLKPGSIIVDHSTVDPKTTQQNATAAKKHEIAYLDAPILGRPSACGNWIMPVGGDKQVLEQILPVLTPLTKEIVNVGPPGAGNALKLLNNMMFAAINVITAEVMAICPKVGVDRRTFFELVSNSDAATVSKLFLELGPKILEDRYDPVFTVDLLHKDLSLGVQMARDHGQPPLASMVNLWLVETAQTLGLGKLDSASLVKIFDRSA